MCFVDSKYDLVVQAPSKLALKTSTYFFLWQTEGTILRDFFPSPRDLKGNDAVPWMFMIALQDFQKKKRKGGTQMMCEADMCQGLNSHAIGDGHQLNSRGF